MELDVLHSEQTLDTATIYPPFLLVGICTHAQQQNIRTDRWFAGLGFDADQIRDPDFRMSFRQASAVLKRALRHLNTPDIGLLAGQAKAPADYGVLAFAMMSCATFDEAMRVAMQFHRISGCVMDMRLIRDKARNLAYLEAERSEAEPELLPFLCEEFFVGCLRLTQYVVGRRLVPLRIELSYPRPAHADAYRRVFGCEAQFDCPHNRMIVDDSWLSRQLPLASPLGIRHGESMCRQADIATTETDLISTVRRQLLERIDTPPKLEQIAGSLNLSERTLRRRLAHNGLSYRSLLSQAREQRARELLRAQPRHSVGDIASALGFYDEREFRRAFKRWTGGTPGAFR